MTRETSPYAGKSEEEWKGVTKRLRARHPLKDDVILQIATASWAKVWETTVGSGKTAIRLTELRVPASVIGYFFEVLFAKELENRFPGQWRGNQNKDEKDLVYVPDPGLSVEIKTSGQRGWKVYGNRSYGQEVQDEGRAKKEKSGYYLTANFYERVLALLRFGWIDASDWKSQASATGQMAALSASAYEHKLIIVPGAYRLEAPVRLVEGIGEKAAEQLTQLGIRTIGDFIHYKGELPSARLGGIREKTKTEHGMSS